MVVSTMYHMCRAFNLCVFRYTTHRDLDFFFAQFLIIISIMYFIRFSVKYPWVKPGLIMFGAIIIVVLQTLFYDEGLVVQALIVVLSFICLVFYWVFIPKFPQYNMSYLIMGLTLTGIATMLYSYQSMTISFYGSRAYIHGTWHMTAAFGQFFLIFIKSLPTKKTKRNKKY